MTYRPYTDWKTTLWEIARTAALLIVVAIVLLAVAAAGYYYGYEAGRDSAVREIRERCPQCPLN